MKNNELFEAHNRLDKAVQDEINAEYHVIQQACWDLQQADRLNKKPQPDWGAITPMSLDGKTMLDALVPDCILWVQCGEETLEYYTPDGQIKPLIYYQMKKRNLI